MIFLFHGDDFVNLRKSLVDFKQKYENLSTIYFEGKDWSIEELKQAIETWDMFAQKKLIVAEMVKAKEKEVLPFFDDLPTEVDLAFVYFEKLTQNSAFLKKTKEGGKIFLFSLPDPKKVFPFLDAFASRNQKRALQELDILFRESNDSFYIITMIAWQLRNLIKVKELGSNVPDLHPFVIRKSLVTAKNFEMEELLNFYNKLWQLDLDIKIGKKDAVVGIQEIIFGL